MNAPARATPYRGVWLACWSGPHGELVLLVMDSRNRLVMDPVTVPRDRDSVVVADALGDMLDKIDPVSTPVTRHPPVFTRVGRSGRSLKRPALSLHQGGDR